MSSWSQNTVVDPVFFNCANYDSTGNRYLKQKVQHGEDSAVSTGS